MYFILMKTSKRAADRGIVDFHVISHQGSNHRGPQVFAGSEVFSSTSEASSIWQLSRKSHQTLIANNDEPGGEQMRKS